MKPQLVSVAKQKGSILKAVIANQQEKDENRSNFKEDWFNPLIKLFQECNVDAKYLPSPTVDFFYDNSDNPNQLNIYDYDIIILNTHGSNGPLLYYKPDSHWWGAEKPNSIYGVKGHSFMTSEEFDEPIPLKTEDEERPNVSWEERYANFVKWRDKDNFPYKDVSDQHINYSYCKELRNGKWYWIAHPDLTEYFFRDIAPGKFENPNSFFFNCACESIKGDEKDQPSFSLANILFDKNLGIYAGYTEETMFSTSCSYQLFNYMLQGASYEKALQLVNNYYPFCIEETNANIFEKKDLFKDNLKFLYNISVPGQQAKGAKLMVRSNSQGEPSDLFLFPTVTIQADNDLINQEFHNNKTITIEGYVTHSSKGKPWMGFQLSSSSDFRTESTYYYPPEEIEVNHSMGKFHIQMTIPDLTPDKTYYYRAYTYDDLHYNYGEPFSFKIDKPEEPAELTLSTTGPISLEVGESTTVEITSGNGDYTIENKAPSTISVKRNDNILTITALSAGPGTIIVTDTKTGQTKEITVEVKDSESSSGWVNLISNGDMESTDVSCFFERTGTYEIDAYHATISNGVGKNGSRGIKVAATARQKEHYDNQFWFRMNEPISAGTRYRFSFDYRADRYASVETEIHGEPSEYIAWNPWPLKFESEWKTFYYEDIVTSTQSTDETPFRSIAFDLSADSEANNYYFDNIKFEIYKEGEEPVADLALSSTSPISLKVGESKTITITSGSGNYSVKSSDDKVASVSRNGNTVTIKAVSAGPATITITDIKSGKTKSIEVEVKATSGVISYTACPDTHHPHWIDLGLPSGTKWSCCNEGASAPEEFGEYYEYGEVLTAPSQIQGEELIKYTTYSWGTLNGVNGGLFTGKNGGTIFLPATGSNENGNIQYVGEEGHYWPLASGSYVWTLGFNYDHPEMWSGIYYGGVRGIRRTVRSVSK